MRTTTITALALSVASLTGSGCGQSDGFAGVQVRTYVGSQSPGDVITVQLNYAGGLFTFTSDNGTTGTTADDPQIGGNLELLSSGFLKLTVTSAVNVSVATDGTAIAYAMEVPGLVLLVKPAGSGEDIMALAYQGGCDSILSDYNWVQVAFGSESYNVNTSEAYGTATLSGTTSSITVSGNKFTMSGTDLGAINPPGPGSCSNGQIEFTSDSINGFISAAGAMILDNGSGNGGIIAFKQNSLTLADVGSRTYIGLFFEPNSDDIKPVQLNFTSATSGTGALFDNVETGAVSSTNSGTVTLSSISNGLLTASFTNTDGTTNMKGMVYQTADGTALVLIGADVGSTAPFVIILATPPTT